MSPHLLRCMFWIHLNTQVEGTLRRQDDEEYDKEQSEDLEEAVTERLNRSGDERTRDHHHRDAV